MSARGAASMAVRADGMNVAIVASSWHAELMDALVAGASRALEDMGAASIEVLRVAGSFELPLGAKAAAQAGFDAVVALGVVLRGGTPHFDYVCQGATTGLTQAGLDTGVPIGFGVLTCDTEEQAFARSGLPGSSEDKGKEAAEAAVAMVHTLRRVAVLAERLR